MRTEAHERAYRREMLAECGIIAMGRMVIVIRRAFVERFKGAIQLPCHDRDTCTHPTLSFAVEGVFWLVEHCHRWGGLNRISNFLPSMMMV